MVLLRRISTVVKLNSDGTALISADRQSACGENCGSCAGCDISKIKVTAVAENQAGAAAGETVIVESELKGVLYIAFVVYIIPILMFFLCYALASFFSTDESIVVICALAGFFLSFRLGKLLDKKHSKNSGSQMKIVSVVKNIPEER